MNRRSFLSIMLGAAAVTTLTRLQTSQALAMPVMRDGDELAPQADAASTDACTPDGEPVENVQYWRRRERRNRRRNRRYGRRRRRRVCRTYRFRGRWRRRCRWVYRW